MEESRSNAASFTSIAKQAALIFRKDVGLERAGDLGLRRWSNVGAFIRRVLLGDRVALLLAVDIPISADGPFRRLGDFFYNSHFANVL